MKAIIHLQSNGLGFHRAVGIEVNIGSAPQKGDWIALCEADCDRLFNELKSWEDRIRERRGWQKTYGDDRDYYREWWDEEDGCYQNYGALTVTETALLPEEDTDMNPIPGSYILHIIVEDSGR